MNRQQIVDVPPASFGMNSQQWARADRPEVAELISAASAIFPATGSPAWFPAFPSGAQFATLAVPRKAYERFMAAIAACGVAP